MGISRLRIGEISSPELWQGLVEFHAHRLMGSSAQELVFYPFSNLEVHSDILPYKLLASPRVPEAWTPLPP